MLDLHNGTALIEGYLAARHAHLVRERRMHLLAGEVRATRATRSARPRRRALPRLRVLPAVR